MKAIFFAYALILALPARASETPSRFGWTYESVKPDTIRQVEAAADFLAKTPTGASVLAALKAFPIQIYVDNSLDGNGSYDDEESALSLNGKYVQQAPPWKLARLLCHELTHAVQHSLGIDRANYDNNSDKPVSASGVMEFSALSMEVRFWIEAGAPIEETKDFNNLRMWAYLYFPETVRVGWAYTNDMQRFKEPVSAWADERLANYWNGVLASEQEWRAKNAAKFPARFKDAGIALLYLKDRYKRPVSPWLPAYLEKLGSLPGTPSKNDLELIQLHR